MRETHEEIGQSRREFQPERPVHARQRRWPGVRVLEPVPGHRSVRPPGDRGAQEDRHPDPQGADPYSMTVLAFVIVMILFIFGLDTAFSWLSRVTFSNPDAGL